MRCAGLDRLAGELSVWSRAAVQIAFALRAGANPHARSRLCAAAPDRVVADRLNVASVSPRAGPQPSTRKAHHLVGYNIDLPAQIHDWYGGEDGLDCALGDCAQLQAAASNAHGGAADGA